MRARIVIVAILAALIGCAWFASAPDAPPPFDEVRARWRPSDAQLLDRKGDPLYERRVDSHGRRLAWTPIDEISPALLRAVIASEDRRFYDHDGVDARAIGNAGMHALLGARTRGASTITMQVASMIDPSLGRGGRRSAMQKLQQIRSALALERTWSKAQILEAYLNLVTWRGELEGINAASRVMLGKAPHGVNAGEGIVMAALVRAPNAGRAAVARRSLKLLAALGADAPSQAEVDAALDRVYSHSTREFARVTLAPHVAERMLTAGQLSARCTLDSELQRFAAETLKRHVSEVRDRGVDDGAALVVDNASGEVWAYVGSAGDTSGAPWVDGVRASRQPGSALKPFLYALAIDRHFLTAASLVEDTPLELPEERGLYRPADYDHQFRGLVSMRTALASSLNLPAVRTASLVGVDAFAANLNDLGMDSVVEPGDFYGASLALGSADVTLWELVGAYRTLADGGTWSPLRLTAAAPAPQSRRIYSPAAAFVVSDVLADRASRSVTFGLENSLATRYWSAVKTGTSKDMRDNWCAGYSDRFTVGVWVGNVTGAPMRDVTGITGAAPVWLDVMNYLHDRYGSGAIHAPAGVVARRVEFADAVEAPREEWFLAGTEPVASRAKLDRDLPRIESPADGSIIAFDPDIPHDQQRVSFEAGRGSEHARWKLDGRIVCATASSCMWEPRAGAHKLVLESDSGHALDKVEFTVRGTASPGDEEVSSER
ncbi:MAG TPA: penicillin-binding protein 1C [Candidatus Binataceae bacterium]|nr:penicillin-binding protein 1C [Candidatus Binataceae bacterium]